MTTLESINQKINEISLHLTTPKKISVDVREASEMIGVSKSTIYILMENKELQYSTIGGKKVIRVKEIERLLSDREIHRKPRKSA